MSLIDFDTVLAMLRKGDSVLVGIDGLPVSGKSTLTERLETELGAVTVYLDDFVRPEAEWRGIVKPGFPFPHFRYDAFLSAVTTLARGETARYRPYDWATGKLKAWREVSPGGLVVVEGVSALHPQLAPLYGLRIWVKSDTATTLEAAIARGVGDWEREWRELFMPSVEFYLGTDPQRRADYVVAGRGAAVSAQG